MSEELQGNKKMSKGCMTALIVVGVIVVLIVSLMVVCYVNKDKLAKSGTGMIINQVKQWIAETPPTGVDTLVFNAVTDSFMSKFELDEIDYNKVQLFFPVIQNSISDELIDSSEAYNIMQGMVEYYPDIQVDGFIPEEFDLNTEVTPDTELETIE